MKYNATKLHDGGYAVKARGNKYYTHTASETEYEATLYAIEMSADWLQEQQKELYERLMYEYELSADDAYSRVYATC